GGRPQGISADVPELLVLIPDVRRVGRDVVGGLEVVGRVDGDRVVVPYGGLAAVECPQGSVEDVPGGRLLREAQPEGVLILLQRTQVLRVGDRAANLHL